MPDQITVLVPFINLPDYFIGFDAGELRAYGFIIDEAIPDCARVESTDGNTARFNWVSIDIILKPDGTVEPANREET